MALLVLNAGSSNLKASVFEIENGCIKDTEPVFNEKITWQKSNSIACKNSIMQLLRSIKTYKIDAVGHRIVHGGDKYIQPVLITDEVLQNLKELIELAPLHEPISIAGIECVKEVLGDIKQIAVFDTAFHACMPESSKVYPLPYEWYEKLGIKRFGFHGISHQYAAKRATELLGRSIESLKIINCHLGSGASLCAIARGKSLMTTMGYTPLEGLVMGTRAGSIDPGIILHLLKGENYDIDSLEDVLNESCGLKGICGISDMKEVEKMADSGDKRAQLALDIYINRLTSSIASLLPLLGGLDALVFTGGVGENSTYVRESVCHKLNFAGIKLDSGSNKSAKSDCLISSKQSSANVLIVFSKEDLAIAEEYISSLSAST